MHPVVPKAAALQAAPVKLYRQRSRGVIGGTCTRFGEGHGLEPRLLRHRPQSAWSESNTLLSLIGQRHDPRATGGKDRASWLVSNERLSHHTDGTSPANRTLQARIWSPGPSPEGGAKNQYHRKDSNLHQQPSLGCVPSAERWHVGPEGWNCTSDHGLVSPALSS